MAHVVNASFSSPTADAHYPLAGGAVEGGLLSQLFNGVNLMSISVSLLLILVAYDQCKSSVSTCHNQAVAETLRSHVHME